MPHRTPEYFDEAEKKSTEDTNEEFSDLPTLWPYGRRSEHSMRTSVYGDEAVVQRQGSFRGAVINIGMTAMGLGVLGLADCFECSGLLLGSVLLVCCALVTDLSCILLVKVAYRIKQYSFAMIADHFFGYWGVRLVHLNLALVLFFATTAAFSIPMKTLTVLIRQELLDNDDAAVMAYTEYPLLSKNGWLVGLVQCVLMLIPAYFTSMANLEPLSTFAFVCMVVAMCILLVAFGALFEPAKTSICLATRFAPASFFLGNALVAFTCQYNVLQIYGELKNRKRIIPVIHLSILGIALPLYLLIGIAGVLLADDLSGPADNIFDSIGIGKQAPWLMVVSKVAKYLVVIMTIAKSPLLVNPLRDIVIFELRQIKRFSHWGLHNVALRLGVSAVVLLATYATAIVLPLAIVLGVSGAIVCSFANFILPGAFCMMDLEMYATPSAPRREKLNFLSPRWSYYSPASKKRYVLGAICFSVGLLAMTVGMFGLIKYRIIELVSIEERIKDHLIPKVSQLCAHTPISLR